MTGPSLQVVIVYLVGLLQGITLVTFPAAGTLLTSAEGQGLTSGEYGMLFVPMNLGAIGASLWGGNLGTRYGLKPVFIFGLICNALSMALFASSLLFFGNHFLVFTTMLAALLAMGLGFGSTLTTLNAFISRFFPNKVSSALTGLHTLLGIGTALAPLLFSYFMNRNLWWMDPVVLATLFLFAAAASLWLLDQELPELVQAEAQKLPWMIWMFIAVAFLYGYCETLFGNWSTIYLTKEKHLSIPEAGAALSAFWAMVTAGRLLITFGSIVIPPERIYSFLPILILAVFAGMPLIGGTYPSILIFAAGGLACSGMLPLTIGFAQSDTPSLASVASGRLIASYMLGYGVASYGVGEVVERGGASLSQVYGYGVIFALLLAVFTLLLLRFRKNQSIKPPSVS